MLQVCGSNIFAAAPQVEDLRKVDHVLAANQIDEP